MARGDSLPIRIEPGRVNGRVMAPASKSVAQRAIALAAVCSGRSEIWFPGRCDDVLSAIRVCRSMGARIREGNDALVIDGGVQAPAVALNCGESGLGIRMFSGLSAAFDQEVSLTATGSLLKRPMHIIEHSLQALGVQCRTNEGFPPITVRGPLRGGRAKIDASLSSQVLTGLLMAAPMARTDCYLEVENLKSIPYIDTTLMVMKAFGISVENRGYREFFIPAPQVYRPAKFVVEGDWSGGAFLLVAGAVAGKVRVDNLDVASTQADKKIFQALEAAGAGLKGFDSGKTQGAIEARWKNLRGFEFDATHCPDLFPPLTALAANCQGLSRIHGSGRLAAKESDRAAALIDTFGRIGIRLWIEGGNTLVVEGGEINGGTIDSHGDHRIAMAGAIAALNSKTGVSIENPGVVSKSYPGFFADLEAMKV